MLVTIIAKSLSGSLGMKKQNIKATHKTIEQNKVLSYQQTQECIFLSLAGVDKQNWFAKAVFLFTQTKKKEKRTKLAQLHIPSLGLRHEALLLDLIRWQYKISTSAKRIAQPRKT